MLRAKGFLWAGCILVVVAAAFVIYALNNPQASFPWNNTVTILMYLVYAIVTGIMFVLAHKYKS